MFGRWLKLPSREELEANRFLRPFARHLSSPLVWRFNRRGVARGTALGLFSGFAVPVAQTPFAALFAVAARANLPVAAVATFVTNPFTVPFIYFLAFLVGKQAIGMKTETLFSLTPGAGPIERAIGWTVRSICNANSRVGARMSAWGLRPNSRRLPAWLRRIDSTQASSTMPSL